ncbi:glutathione S-transferase family protein [Halopseudomonas formosensis]|uniref:Glutathione S-transferase family protein n=1 Tax=Halopseudomonas formosensis TaxID=1002526 RepID=A0ABU5BVE3_9GAMM|nr:glutathione S-transferase family protein [Halopseudomonas formosensis]MDX9686738.1 glutathione S-transferase family protein [Halopseudomonas formosensis]
MSLTLYGAILSPYVRKIRIQLAEQQIEHELVPQTPFNQPDWFFDISPLGRIPALKDGELGLADSSVIAQYLQETLGGKPLFGSSPEQAARVRWLEKYADYELGRLATQVIYINRILKPVMGKQCDEAAVAAALEQLPALFDYLEAQLGDQHYFLGEQLSMADIAVCSQLINLAHAGELIDETRWPGLSSLLSRLTSRSSVSSLLPEEHQLVARLTGRA